VSPLKALSNDVHRNLEAPLAELAARAALEGETFPEIRVAVRTGDTPAGERAKMAKKPPHILVTTPESLYILLTTVKGRAALGQLRTVIVDEIHAIAGDKRGAHLALSLERLDRLVRQTVGRAPVRVRPPAQPRARRSAGPAGPRPGPRARGAARDAAADRAHRALVGRYPATPAARRRRRSSPRARPRDRDHRRRARLGRIARAARSRV